MTTIPNEQSPLVSNSMNMLINRLEKNQFKTEGDLNEIEKDQNLIRKDQNSIRKDQNSIREEHKVIRAKLDETLVTMGLPIDGYGPTN